MGEPDLASILTAARAIPPAEQVWWQDAYADQERLPFERSLERLARESPKTLAGMFALSGHLADDDIAPWHFALLARAAGVTRKTTATLGRKPSFVVGSLHVTGPLKLAAPLVVTGDLVVDGPIVDVTETWLVLAVGGSLKAHSIVSSQAIAIGGDCTVRDFIWGFEMHCPFVVRGAVTTPLAVWDDHRPRKLHDATGIDEVLDSPPRADLERHFDPALLDARGIKQKALLMRVLADKPVRPGATKAAKPAKPVKPAKPGPRKKPR